MNEHPTYGSWCAFYNTSDEVQSFRIAKFQTVAFGKGKEGKYKDQQGNYFDECVPIELYEFMKDKIK